MVTGLLGRVRLSLATGGIADPIHGERMVAVPEDTLKEAAAALEAARAAVPWIGVEQIAARLEEALA